MLNMVSTVDGRATLAGRSGPISNRADRELFHGLRATVDAVLVGAGTVRAERYGRIIPDGDRRRAATRAGSQRGAAGLHRLRRLALARGHPAARRAERARGDADLLGRRACPRPRAQVDYMRAARDGRLDLPRGAARSCASASRCSTLLCEGGPHLALRAARGGAASTSCSCRSRRSSPAASRRAARRCGSSPARELDPPVELELLGVLRERVAPVPALRRGLRAVSASRARRSRAARWRGDGPGWPRAAWRRCARRPPRRRAPRA